VSKRGAFVGVIAAYPEDVGIRLTLRFADGRTETHAFGASPLVTPDPGGAMRTFGYQIAGAQNTVCIRMESAREVKPYSLSPVACGDVHQPFFFSARTLREGDHGGRGITTWYWHHPARTVVYGSANKRLVKRLALAGPHGTLSLKPTAGNAFQALLPPRVDPHTLVLVVTLRNGAVERVHAPAHLVPPPGGHR
jgi:hypothetical protein